MKKKILIFTLILTFILTSLPNQNSLAASKYNFKVRNYNRFKITVKLTEVLEEGETGDPKEYRIEVSRFDSKTKELPKAVYDYSYNHPCGGTQTGQFKLKEDITWKIYPCQVAPSKVRLNSHFSQDVTVNLYGPLEMEDPDEEDIKVELGGNPIDNILSGTYLLSYEACDQIFAEEIFVQKNGKTQYTMHGCEWFASPARTYDKPVPVKFKVINHASFPIILQIVGPQGALLNVNPGVNISTLIYGTYKYGYFLDGAYHTGNMMVTKNGLGQLVLRPSHIHGVPTAGSEDSSGE